MRCAVAYFEIETEKSMFFSTSDSKARREGGACSAARIYIIWGRRYKHNWAAVHFETEAEKNMLFKRLNFHPKGEKITSSSSNISLNGQLRYRPWCGTRSDIIYLIWARREDTHVQVADIILNQRQRTISFSLSHFEHRGRKENMGRRFGFFERK